MHLLINNKLLIMEWILKTMRATPELAIFLTLALGVALGKIDFKGFSLGSVTGVLLMGIIVGQEHIEISPIVKSAFFLIFLFAIGYSVGPQFIHSLKKEGIPQILFACIMCLFCLIAPWLLALLCGLDLGNAVGLLSGANTISAVIGVATDSINQLPIEAHEKTKMINEIPIAYAVTYIFGTAGTAWFLSVLGPRILGKDVIKQTKEYEKALGSVSEEVDVNFESAYNGATFRVLEVTSSFFEKAKTVKEVEDYLLTLGNPIFIERIRLENGEIIPEPTLEYLINRGDRLVLNGPLETVILDETFLGSEVADLELLDFRVEVLKVMIVNKTIEGHTLQQLSALKERHGVIIRKLIRGNTVLPLLSNLVISHGDVAEIEGRKSDVDRFAQFLGYAERPTSSTDLLYVGLGIFLGGIVGSLTLQTGNIPLSLSTSGGVLIMGIIFGWLRSRRPTFGAIPAPAIWLMHNLGLNMFIAVVGISAGPNFITGIKALGLTLFVVGVFATLIPLFLGLLVGKYIFKFNPAITLGACAGARTSTAALGEVEDVLGSKVPALAYTTTYAVGNTLLIIWGVVIVILMS